MSILSLRNLTVSFGDRPVLEDAALTLEKGERVCLIGRNGEGKSTLLRVINGEISPDSGEREALPSLSVAKLDQAVPMDWDGTVFDVVAGGIGAPAARLLRYHHLLDAAIADPDNEALSDELDQVQSEVDLHNDWALEHRVERILSKLQVSADAPFTSLSGGLKRRVLLGRALAAEPDILLLDEPTNHLDLPSIEWMESFLVGLDTTLLFVTHDRSFVRKVATSILDLDRGKLTRWNCDYATFLERKADAMNAEAQHWQVFDKKLAEEEVWIRKGIQARRTRNEGRVRALKKLRDERSQRRELRTNAQLATQGGQLSGRKVLTLDEVTYRWGAEPQPIIENFSTTIWRGDKIGIVGSNGSGKSTLLQLMLQKLEPESGSVTHGTKLEVAYFDQHRDQLDENLSVAENVSPHGDTITFNGKSRHILSYLRDFLFSPETARAPIRKLSGGERARVLLARLFSKPANLIIMDEPTNDLDIETVELLEEMLLEFNGTVLLVSHDREFLNNIVTSTIILEGNGRVTEYIGGCDVWLDQQRKARLTATDSGKSKSGAATATAAKPAAAAAPKPRKLTNKERMALETLPKQIEKLETELAELGTAMARPDFVQTSGLTHAEAAQKVSNLEAGIARAYTEWDALEALVVEPRQST